MSRKINLNEFDVKIIKAEGKKYSINIGQVKETRKLVLESLAEEPLDVVIELLMRFRKTEEWELSDGTVLKFKKGFEPEDVLEAVTENESVFNTNDESKQSLKKSKTLELKPIFRSGRSKPL